MVFGSFAQFKKGASALALVAAIMAAGCEQKKPPAPGKMPPAPVTTAHPVSKEVVEWDIYTGHLSAKETTAVVAQVSGMISEMPFTEGDIVKTGDLLVVIDDRLFTADLDAKMADEKGTKATLAIAKLTYDRVKSVLGSASTQQEVDDAKAKMELAEANVQRAQAAVKTSTDNLEYCHILAKIDGRAGRKLITPGNWANGGGIQASVITTIESVSPMYCDFDVDEHSVLKYQDLAAKGKLASTRSGKIPCFVQLANETGFPHQGMINFVDNKVDAATGTLILRGAMENKDGLLTPGMFVRVRVPGSGRYQAVLIPDTAIGNDQDQKNVLVVDDKNLVVPRIVKLGALFGNLRSITDGLKPEERIIVNGQMHARPGSEVAPTDVPIKIDEADFFDPGPGVAMQAPAAPDPALQAAAVSK